jgi:hypothetical protein
MSQFEFIMGFQQEISKNLAFGMKFNHRKVTDGMDDFCGSTGIGQFMKDKVCDSQTSFQLKWLNG